MDKWLARGALYLKTMFWLGVMLAGAALVWEGAYWCSSTWPVFVGAALISVPGLLWLAGRFGRHVGDIRGMTDVPAPEVDPHAPY